METLYEKSSLILNPGVYDTGKVYCTKPFDGSGDLTFTRNSNATRVNADGLVEKVRTNEVTYSNAFTSGNWLGEFLSPTPAASGQTDKDGGTNAWLFTKTTSSGSAYNSQFFTGVYTFSLYVKKETGKGIKIYNFGSVNPNVTVNIETGAIVSQSSATAQVEAYNANWWRVSMTATVSAGRFYIYVTDGTVNQISGTLTIQDAQVEVSDFGPTQYIPTTSAAVSVGPTANVPRLDYSGGACPSLLLEPQRTNLLTYSEQFSNINWLKAGVNITSNTSQTLDPSGYYGADKLVEDSSNGSHVVYAAITGTSGTFSFFAKAAERSWISVLTNDGNRAYFNLSNGTIGAVAGGSTASITPYANGWYRCTVYNTHPTYGASIYLSTGNGITSYQGDGTSGAYIWGAQLEAGSYATSYIPTLGASVTRLADAAYKTGISSLIGQTEGTLFVEFDFNGNYDANGIVALDVLGAVNNEAYIFITGAGLLRLELYVAGALQCLITSSIGAVGRKKIAFAYKANDFVGYMNGVQVGTDTSGTVGAMDTIYVGTYQAPTYATGNMNQTLLFKTRLTNAQLAELTTL